jgi:Xaa-Pro aminopeptidase
MNFTAEEKERRHTAFQAIIKEFSLEALLLIGETAVGRGLFGDFRYYTNNRTIFYRQVAVVFAQSKPVLFAGDAIQTEAAAKRSFIPDCRRISGNLAADVLGLLRERGLSKGRIGVNMEMLPAAWLLHFRKELPEIEWVECHEAIMRLRFDHSHEEMDVYRKGASLGDGGFEAALEVIKPGVSEYEVVAQIEQYARRRGGDEHFTLIASGKFSLGHGKSLPLVYATSGRIIETGDCVTLEITPRYRGYWTQLVRSIQVGTPNHELERLHRICRDALNKGLEELRPGKRIRDLVLTMDRYVTGCGYLLKPPLGHFCGVDLVEARVSMDNEMVLTAGMVVILHPTVFTIDERNSFFAGETYLVSTNGYERLNRAGDELPTV